jgi:hypothetical protein
VTPRKQEAPWLVYSVFYDRAETPPAFPLLSLPLLLSFFVADLFYEL